MSQTIENSYHSTSADMGESHIAIHQNQHTRLIDGEPLIETLSNNKSSDSSYELMKQMAHQQGVKSEAEWKQYNQTIRPVRRKNSYDEYLASLCKKVVSGLQDRLKKKETPRAARANYAQQLASIEKNNEPSIGTPLFYLSNFHDYEAHQDDYEQYRKFERETYQKFYNSDGFKALNPGCFRGEIHFDELGTMHLQTQSVWFKTDKTGRAQYSKRMVIKKSLVNYYGSTAELNRRLDMLSWIHGDPNLSRNPGDERIDSKLNRMIANNEPVERPASTRERNGRLEELWRIEQLNVLNDVALQTAKKYNVDWQPATTYQTDRVHRGRDAYIEHEKQVEQVNKQYQQVNNRSQSTKEQLEHDRALVKRAQDRLTQLSANITDSYEAITDTKRPDNMTDLEAVRTIRRHVKSAKNEHDKNEQENQQLEAENQRLKAENEKRKQVNLKQPWYVLRQLIVDIIQSLMPVLRELDRDHVTGQRWRDSVTEQVDRQMKQSSSPVFQPKKSQNGKSNELER